MASTLDFHREHFENIGWLKPITSGDEEGFEGYDKEAWEKAGSPRDPETGHGPDTFKKPEHITFSDESMHHGKDGAEGGHWRELGEGRYSFTPGKTNLEHHSMKELRDYFKKHETGNVLQEDMPIDTTHNVPLGASALVRDGKHYGYAIDKNIPDSDLGLPGFSAHKMVTEHHEKPEIDYMTKMHTAGLIDWLFGKGKEEEKPSEEKAPLPTHFPSTDDLAEARKARFGYKSGMESYFRGETEHPVESRGYDTSVLAASYHAINNPQEFVKAGYGNLERKDVGDYIQKNAMVANRSPITAVGFDPRRFAIDVKNPETPTTTAGFYEAGRTVGATKIQDVGWVNKLNDLPSVMFHEATHRGVQLMKDAGVLSKQEKAWLDDWYPEAKGKPTNEELMVRFLEQKYAGLDPDKKLEDGDLYNAFHEQAKRIFQDKYNQKMLEDIERKAEDFFAKQHPQAQR